jgi:hypothetical protein
MKDDMVGNRPRRIYFGIVKRYRVGVRPGNIKVAG